MKKTWIVGIVLALIALPAVAQSLPAGVAPSEEVHASPAEEPALEVGEREPPAAELPELFGEGLQIEAPASHHLCPICINSYCSAVGTRCTYTSCSFERECCFYDCAPDPTCTTAQKCPINVCFCISPL